MTQPQPDKGLEESSATAATSERQDRQSDTCPCQNKATHAHNLPWWRDSQWWQVIIAFVLVPFGIYAAIWVYPDQLEEMRKATRAATEANKNARENAHLDQRAWVAPSDIAGKAQKGEPYNISVSVKNTGRTFALEYKVLIGFKRQELSDPTPDFDGELVKLAATLSNESMNDVSLIPPDGILISTVKASYDKKLGDEEMKILSSPINVMYVFGKLTYKDIFNCPHWTKFSVRCFPDGTYQSTGTYGNADNNRCP